LKVVRYRLNEFLAVALLGGALAIDNRSSLRIMLSQPVCSGLLVGIVLGAPDEGLFVGVMFQVMFLGYVHIRGVRIPDIPIGGVAASALYILSAKRLGSALTNDGIILSLSLVVGILVSVIGYGFYRLWERKSWNLVDLSMRSILEGKLRLAAAIHMSALAIHFLYAFLVLIVLLPAVVPIITLAAAHAAAGPESMIHSLQYIVPFMGVGSLARLYFVKSRAFWFGAGFLASYVFLIFR
jgi:mannose/fructose/N-acetylgalactosamine-specific phosphotransferase system component IIC